jgi:hypothetical protein
MVLHALNVMFLALPVMVLKMLIVLLVTLQEDITWEKPLDFVNRAVLTLNIIILRFKDVNIVQFHVLLAMVLTQMIVYLVYLQDISVLIDLAELIALI